MSSSFLGSSSRWGRATVGMETLSPSFQDASRPTPSVLNWGSAKVPRSSLDSLQLVQQRTGPVCGSPCHWKVIH